MSRFGSFFDTLQNLVTGLGQRGIDPSVNVQYILSLLDRNALENMYRGDWLARKIVDAVADDATREWRAWQANQDQIEALEEVEQTLDLQRKVKQWLLKARLYGGSALVLGVDDGQDPSQPINLEKCQKGCLKYVVVLHRYELNAGPRIYNVSDPFYTRPAYFTVATPMFGFEGEAGVTTPSVSGRPESVPGSTAKNSIGSKIIPFMSTNTRTRQYPNTTPTNLGMTQIHPSRVLEMSGNELPDWRLAPMGGGWGDSVLQTVVDSMQQFTTILGSVSAMVSDGKLDVVKIPDMALNLTTPGYKDRLIERFTLSAQTKSVISALLLDKEEEWQRVSTNYGGLPQIMHEFITIISGASSIPVSRLFGQAMGRGLSGGSTSGGGGGGEADLRNYYDDCTSLQKNEITPRLQILDEVLKRSALGSDDPNIDYDWNPLWQTDDDDKAKIAFSKAQTTQIYALTGLINEDAFREGVVNQLIEDGTYPGLDDAIEQHGMEPEEPEMAGGFMPGQGPPPGTPGAFPGEAGGHTAAPNMASQHSGGPPAQPGEAKPKDAWSAAAWEASAEARQMRKNLDKATKWAVRYNAKHGGKKRGVTAAGGALGYSADIPGYDAVDAWGPASWKASADTREQNAQKHDEIAKAHRSIIAGPMRMSTPAHRMAAQAHEVAARMWRSPNYVSYPESKTNHATSMTETARDIDKATKDFNPNHGEGGRFSSGESGSPGAEEDLKAARARGPAAEHGTKVDQFMKKAAVAKTIAKKTTDFAVSAGIEAGHRTMLHHATEALVAGVLAHLVPETGTTGTMLAMAAAPLVHHGIHELAAKFGVTPHAVHGFLKGLGHSLLSGTKDAEPKRDSVREALAAFVAALDAWQDKPTEPPKAK